ncbi:uncharacterized protein LOC144527589 isoform X2 [Sander vitreus]
MPPLLLHAFTCVCVLTATAGVSAVTTETVVGVAGRKVTLPCRLEAARRGGVEVCWGRGEPSLFTCHNAVINAAGDQLTYRKSHRYSVSSSYSLSIFPSRPSDSGFYHCRVQLAGLFNDQISSVYVIIINPRSVVSDPSDSEDAGNLNTPLTPTRSVVSDPSDSEDAGNLNTPLTPSYSTRDVTTETGSDVTADNITGPMVAPVQQQRQVNSLHTFIGNTVRVSFIVFIPALLLTAAYSVWRSESDRRLNQSEEEEEEEEAGSSV